MQAQPVCEEINPRGGIQNRIDYDALASGLSDNANVHISRASVSDTDSKLKSMGKEISLVGTIKSKVNLKKRLHKQIYKRSKNKHSSRRCAGARKIHIVTSSGIWNLQVLQQGTTMGNFLGKKQKSEKDKQNGRNSTP